MASFVFNVGYLTDQSNINTYTPVSCTFKFYHTNTSKLSSLRSTTADKQIVFDTDDADINNQVSPFANGNIGLIFASTVINGIDYFALVSITSTGADVYTGKMELKPSQNPTISITGTTSAAGNTASGTSCYINENVTINQTSSALYQWTYNGLVHYHKNTYYGITIFPKVGISKVEYKVLDANNVEVVPYQTSNIVKFSSSQYYTLYAKCYNQYNQTAEATKVVFFYKHPISATITHSPFNPMSKQDYSLTITISQTDDNYLDSRLVEVVNSTETELKNFITTTYMYDNQKTKYQNTITYKLYYSYFNGLNNITLSQTYNINMQLRPSVLKITASEETYENNNDGKDDWKIVPTIYYGDGAFTNLKYDLYFITPFSQVETKVNTYIKTNQNDLDQVISFTQNGEYKVVGLLTDEFGGTSSDTTNITINSDGLVIVEKAKPLSNIIFDRE